jgi:hypothetical protein
MIDILSITGTIFVLIGVGFLSVRLGLFSSGEMQTLGKFVVDFALPALILRAVSSQSVGKIADVGYLGTVLFGSLAVFWAGYLWSRHVAGESASASTPSAPWACPAQTAGLWAFPSCSSRCRILRHASLRNHRNGQHLIPVRTKQATQKNINVPQAKPPDGLAI